MRHIILICMLLALSTQVGRAQRSGETVRRDSIAVLGVNSLAEAPVVKSKPPKGYEPVYISHYGRHGARRATNDKNYNAVRTQLQRAHDAGKLTPLGEQIYADYVLKDYPRLAGNPGELTLKGQAQHRAVAAAMTESYPKLFKRAKRVSAESSVVTRCVQSMCAFCLELQSRYPSLQIDQQVSPRRMNCINPIDPDNYVLTPEDKPVMDGYTTWRPELDEYLATIYDVEPLLGKLFNDSLYAHTALKPLSFAKTLYSVGTGDGCLDFEPAANLLQLFTLDDLFHIWEAYNAITYVKDGPGFGKYQSLNHYADTLVTDIIEKADADLASGDCSARLRFGHDMSLMGLLSNLEADSWGVRADNFADIKQTWHNYLIPMGTHLQFVFYRNKRSGDVLFRLLLNGVPMRLPIEASPLAPDSTYYSWEAFKAHRAQRHK